MQTEDFLNKVSEQIKYKPIRKDICEEMKSHINDIKEEYIKNGLNEKEAEVKAILQMGDAEEIGKKLNKIHKNKFDWKLFIIAIILLSFGFLISYVRTNSIGIEYGINYMIKFVISIAIGTLLGIGIYFLDYKKLLKYAKYFYIVATIIVIYTLSNGAMINGSKFLRIFGTNISVGSIAMPLYTIAFIGFLTNINKKSKIQEIIEAFLIKAQSKIIKYYKIIESEDVDYDLNKSEQENIEKINMNIKPVIILLLSVISIFLLLLIPTIATAFVLFLIYLVITTVYTVTNSKKHVKLKIATLLLTPIILGAVITCTTLITSPYKSYRIIGSFYPEQDPQGSGWVGVNSKRVINSAKALGEAEDLSDSINIFDEGTNYAFLSILAHYGWIVVITLVLAVLLLSTKLIINAKKIKDIYGKMLIVGISSMFILQSLFNILMNINKGIKANFNIPFVSYGTADLIINIMCLALVLSVYRRKNNNIEYSKAQNEALQ